MPVAYVDIPAGVNDGAKKKIFQELVLSDHVCENSRVRRSLGGGR
jgi:hypothetical protein